MNTDLNFLSLYQSLATLPEVEAIALGGSRASNQYDEQSDYDLYVYCQTIPNLERRKTILEPHCQYLELNNTFWEVEDDAILNNGIPIDIIYRSLNDFSQSLHQVVQDHVAYNGYTTCLWHNLLQSQILYDPKGKLKALQKEYRIAYPQALRQNILHKNWRLLTENLPSYDKQIQKAMERNDWVSVNHRTAAFLESYFDLLFALNSLTHPGEKRMVSYLKEQATILPAHFEENLNLLFKTLFINPDQALQTLQAMVLELAPLIEEEKKQ